MAQNKHPLATALHQCHKNGDDKTKRRVLELVELMRRVSRD